MIRTDRFIVSTTHSKSLLPSTLGFSPGLPYLSRITVRRTVRRRRTGFPKVERIHCTLGPEKTELWTERRKKPWKGWRDSRRVDESTGNRVEDMER